MDLKEKLITKIELDKEVNKRCLQEETIPQIRSLLELCIQYDDELLHIIYTDNEDE